MQFSRLQTSRHSSVAFLSLWQGRRHITEWSNQSRSHWYLWHWTLRWTSSGRERCTGEQTLFWWIGFVGKCTEKYSDSKMFLISLQANAQYETLLANACKARLILLLLLVITCSWEYCAVTVRLMKSVQALMTNAARSSSILIDIHASHASQSSVPGVWLTRTVSTATPTTMTKLSSGAICVVISSLRTPTYSSTSRLITWLCPGLSRLSSVVLNVLPSSLKMIFC